MGFLSKIWGGIKKAVKSIGKSIKSGIKSVGRFMDKIGIAGQIGLMFILPGIGGMLSKGLSILSASANPLISGVANVITTAGKFANTVGNAFKSVTDGVMSFVSEVGKGFVNQTTSMLGSKTPFFSQGPANVVEGFKSWMNGMGQGASTVSGEAAMKVVDSIDAGFEQSFGTTDFVANQKDFRFYEVPPNKLGEIQTMENTMTKSFLDTVKESTKNVVEQFPNRAANAASEAVINKGLEAAGLVQAPEYSYNTSVTNVPEFNSASPIGMYESNGIGYGALPDNRIQFFAAQNLPDTDFGFSAYNQFIRFRP